MSTTTQKKIDWNFLNHWHNIPIGATNILPSTSKDLIKYSFHFFGYLLISFFSNKSINWSIVISSIKTLIFSSRKFEFSIMYWIYDKFLNYFLFEDFLLSKINNWKTLNFRKINGFVTNIFEFYFLNNSLFAFLLNEFFLW